MLSYIIGILVMVVFIMISVALHELGHMIPAKRFGVYVPQYMVGFGPTLWSKTIGETEYGIKWILLGGYVRLAGMFRPAPPGVATERKDGRPTLAQEAREASAEELPAGRQHQAFYRLSVPKKLTVMLGGPVVNLVMSVLLFAFIILGVGLNAPSTTVARVPECFSPDGTCSAEHSVRTPASEAGIQSGDQIVSWNGQVTDTWKDITGAIERAGKQPSTVVVNRDGQELTLQLQPALFGGAYKAGIVSQLQRQRGGLGQVADVSWATFTGTAKVVFALPKAVWDTAVGTFSGQERDPNSVLSIVGVGRLAGEVSAEGGSVTFLDRMTMMLAMWASLNMALFVFNLIPLPPLDGGHVAGALWEGVRRQFNRVRGRRDPGAADTARLVPLTYAVSLALVAMTVVLVVADIVNPIHLP
ncbi:MAG: site-2 protease family protein [Actinomycetaceae bacterium]|nr:site-2 protease family protein [Actinomycetaceae bacterium]